MCRSDRVNAVLVLAVRIETAALVGIFQFWFFRVRFAFRARFIFRTRFVFRVGGILGQRKIVIVQAADQDRCFLSLLAVGVPLPDSLSLVVALDATGAIPRAQGFQNSGFFRCHGFAVDRWRFAEGCQNRVPLTGTCFTDLYANGELSLN